MKPGDKQVAVVVIFTGYTDGTVDFTQTVPDQGNFWGVKRCLHAARSHLTSILRDGVAACPFSPRNTENGSA